TKETSRKPIATPPHPPACNSTSRTRNACSTAAHLIFPEFFRSLFSPHRTHSRREKSVPATAPESGWKASLVSIRAQNSPRLVADPRAERNTQVRTEEERPQISLRQPRG